LTAAPSIAGGTYTGPGAQPGSLDNWHRDACGTTAAPAAAPAAGPGASAVAAPAGVSSPLNIAHGAGAGAPGSTAPAASNSSWLNALSPSNLAAGAGKSIATNLSASHWQAAFGV